MLCKFVVFFFFSLVIFYNVISNRKCLKVRLQACVCVWNSVCESNPYAVNATIHTVITSRSLRNVISHLCICRVCVWQISITDFLAKSEEHMSRLADNILDSLTNGEHSRHLKETKAVRMKGFFVVFFFLIKCHMGERNSSFCQDQAGKVPVFHLKYPRTCERFNEGYNA